MNETQQNELAKFILELVSDDPPAMITPSMDIEIYVPLWIRNWAIAQVMK